MSAFRIRMVVPALAALIFVGCGEQSDPAVESTANSVSAAEVEETTTSRAYKGHVGDQDMSNLVAAYPRIAGSRLDDCQSCHTGGEVVFRGRTRFKNACDYCHLIPFPDDAAEGAPASFAQTLNPYGQAYLEAGRSIEAIAGLVQLDSDGDGFANDVEIGDLRYPGSAGSRPGQPRAKTIILEMNQLRAMPAHSQFQLVNSHRQALDSYATYTGVRVVDLLTEIGVDPSEISGITIVAADGFMKDFDSTAITARYPNGLFFGGLNEETLGAGCAVVTYPSSIPEGLADGKQIPGEPWLMLAYGRDGETMDPSHLDPTSGRTRGEGPLRVIVPQTKPGPPDRGSRVSPSGCDDRYDNDEGADHNAGGMARAVVAVRINPMPEGYEEFDAHNGGWAYVDAGQLVVYGYGIE